MLGEAPLGETRVSVQNPLDPSDIGKINSQTEDAHRARVPGTRPSPVPVPEFPALDS
jgi:hypothetical protein